MQPLAEAVVLIEDGLRRASNGCLRSELINRCFLASLYEAQLAARSGLFAPCSAGKFGSPIPGQELCNDTLPKAMCNLERATALAAQLREYEVLTYCAIGLAELQISCRDLAAASATFDGCVASCTAIADVPLRASLLQRLLPKSMEVCNMQGRTADSFVRLRLLNTVLALNGRCVTEECSICGKALSGDRACLALGCGHSFHRDCCDSWLGRKMFICGTFRAECPVCTQVDWSLKPTPAALLALEEFKVACASCNASGSSGGPGAYGLNRGDNAIGDAGSSSGSSSSGSSSSSERGSNSDSTVKERCTKNRGSYIKSEGSSCSGSSDGSDGGNDEGAEDCADSKIR
ncbi:hypothetical protein Vretimale_9266 [Volvox reticuliferus]|uniref:RING-type domain-containing protein n=1 Tax=Volvox reticuliferus TaxID=1737510 RepID=A0A8J4GD15_9CHLO|nr:hypothetical protein Vretifemale_10162 [Volvox reticuliferus]GIM04781.1 hypothetical protein Vretimale_9266 [Volvox reticuliferus]